MSLDLDRAITELRAQKEKLEQVIAALEDLQAADRKMPRVPKRRGRKFMDAAQRQEVSERMQRYWAGRRAASGG